MNAIQPLLIVLISAALIMGLGALRSPVITKVLVAGLYLVAVLLIAQPERANLVAHIFGVGRGADLLLYILAISFVFASILCYRRFRLYESRYISLVRHLAIENARRRELDRNATGR